VPYVEINVPQREQGRLHSRKHTAVQFGFQQKSYNSAKSLKLDHIQTNGT
jgi:hypothetical protein